jgi:hypothetical protein
MAIKKDTLDQLLDGRDPSHLFTRWPVRRVEKGFGGTGSERRVGRSSRQRGLGRVQESAERLFGEDGPDGDGEDRRSHPPRSRGHVRSEADPALSATRPRPFSGQGDRVGLDRPPMAVSGSPTPVSLVWPFRLRPCRLRPCLRRLASAQPLAFGHAPIALGQNPISWTGFDPLLPFPLGPRYGRNSHMSGRSPLKQADRVRHLG